MRRIYLFLIVFMLFVTTSVIGCNNQATFKEDSYANFEELHSNVLNNFKPLNFEIISKNETTMMSHTFPEGLKIDSRQSDSIDDNVEKPSKYEIFFQDKQHKNLVKVNLIFTPSNSKKGIVFYQIISPFDNVNIIEKYHDIPRPIIIETLASFGNYSISLNTISLDDSLSTVTNEKVKGTINTHWEFFKQLEAFLIENYNDAKI
ncbi:hypothetical protein JOC37_001448 [Desulfohalotomaculum tongense]|uniref:hypothetical protein n=1 Tax=Desulforadius tongensis TaxID=1216062 RepID=UPI00195A5FE8|nr:hypothetical protein [Desulforadius tongensis]MBM7855065.1 hypothetical protein [Desulforadius tongensis]